MVGGVCAYCTICVEVRIMKTEILVTEKRLKNELDVVFMCRNGLKDLFNGNWLGVAVK